MNFRLAMVATFACVGAFTPQTSFAQPAGWYIGLGGGFGPMRYDFAYTPDPSIESDTDFALRAIATVGYKHPSGFRAELEPTYSQYRVNDAAKLGVGTITTYGGYANLLYDWAISRRFNIVLGGGVGWTRMNAEINEASPGLLTAALGSKSGFAWQAIAGVSAALSHNAEIQLDYRYGGLPSGNFNSDIGPLSTARLSDIRTQIAMLSLRWYPGMRQVEQPTPLPPPPPPPAPAPLPPPPPPRPSAPPPPVRTFIVFFDFDKWNLTLDAQQVVAQAVRTAREVGVVRIVVTGHTDTAHARPGTAQAHAYNQALSERRAAAVREEMVRHGMNPGEIITQGRSSDDPLVVTGPGVREPQNRRAVIELR